MEQVIIIGSGPAGLTAAIYCSRADLAPLVIDGMQPGGQLTQTTEVENFPGFENGIDGNALVETMRRQAERFGAKFKLDAVTGIKAGNPHEVSLMSGEKVQARTVILACGASARYLGLPSEQALMGRGVSACATCDGAFFRNQEVAIVGGGDTAMEEALFLTRFCSKVSIIHRRDALRASVVMAERATSHPKIEMCWDSVVEEVLGEEEQTVKGVRLKNVKTGELSDLPVSGLFIAIGHTPNTEAFRGVIDLDEEGFVVADERCRTSVEGIFAAGDVSDRHYKQAITAAGTGCAAALEAERFLRDN